MENNIYAAFKELQNKFVGVAKDKTVNLKGYSYKHATLNSVLDMVKEHCGDTWEFTQIPIFKDGKSLLETTFIYLPTGEKISGQIELPTTSDPKLMGASLTYFRRYSLICMLNMNSYDDEKELEERKKDIEGEGLHDCLVNAILEAKSVAELANIYKREAGHLTKKQRAELIDLSANKKRTLGAEHANI